MTDAAPILPGATLGMLGGGQLGRMFALEAKRMGYRVAVLADAEDSPAGQVADRVIHAPYDDTDAAAELARGAAVVTYEFENVPAPTVEAAARHAPVRPGGDLLFATQERLREKAALVRLGLPVATHAAIESHDDLDPAAERVGFPAILKTAAWGYDGKGQRRVSDAAGLEAAWRELGEGRAVLEAVVPFEAELSVVAARSPKGEVRAYAPFLNHHANHILDVTVAPAPVASATRAQADELARTLLEGFDVVGLLCVETFLLASGELLVNEIAPRTHNSGHVTMDAHVTSQFEQQVRAVCGLPLGSTELLGGAGAMANLLGDVWENGEPRWDRVLAEPGVRLHLYGKGEARPGRKMGHLSVKDDDPARAEARVRRARELAAGRTPAELPAN